MSSSSSMSYIPLLNGNNFTEWNTALIAYLCMLKVHRVLNTTKPPRSHRNTTDSSGNVTGTVETTSAETQKRIDDWEDMNDQARGVMILRTPPNMHYLIINLETAKEVYETLKAHYRTPGTAAIFTDFKDAIHFEMADNVDPTSSLTSLLSMFSPLDTMGLSLPNSVKCMIIIAALPRAWDGMAANILANYTLRDMNLDNIISIIIDEYKRRNPPASTLSSRISGVKRHNKNPNWSNQKKAKDDSSSKPKDNATQQKSSGSAEGGDKKKKPRNGKRGGKKANESTTEKTEKEKPTDVKVATVNVPRFQEIVCMNTPEFIQGSSTQTQTHKEIQNFFAQSAVPMIIDGDGFYDAIGSDVVLNEGTEEELIF